MSKEQIHKRLDNLFSELGKESNQYPTSDQMTVGGWTWECDPNGYYIHISPEVGIILGIPPEDFIGKHISRFRLPAYSTAALKSTINSGKLPAEVVLDFITYSDQLLSVSLYIYTSQPDSTKHGITRGLRGFAQVSSSTPDQVTPPDKPKISTGSLLSRRPGNNKDSRSPNSRQLYGYVAEEFGVVEAKSALSPTGNGNQLPDRIAVRANHPGEPSALTLQTGQEASSTNILLEIVDDNSHRQWSEDDRLLVEQVTDQLTLALENAQLFQDTQARAEELGILHDISMELAEEQRDLDLVTEILVQRAAELLEADDAAIWLWREEEQVLELVVSLLEGSAISMGQSLKPSEGLIGNAFTERTSRLTNNYMDTGIFKRNQLKDPFGTAMAVPLNWQSQVIGVLFVCRVKSNTSFTANERQLAELLAGQGATVIQNARLFEQIQSTMGTLEVRAKELGVLNEMSRAFSTNLDVHSVIRNIYKYTSGLMDTFNFYIALYHPEENNITFENVIADGHLVTEEHPEWLYWSAPQPIGGLTGHVIRNKTHLLVEHNAQEFFEQEGIPYVEVGSGGVQSWLGVPMVIGSRVIGVIAVQSETKSYIYNQRHAGLLSSIGNQAAIAIENARLLEETQRRNEELSTLNKIIGAASRSLDTSETLEEILNHVLVTLDFQSGLISVLDPATDRLRLISHKNLPDELYNRLIGHGLEDTLCELVYTRREIVTVEDFQEGAPVDVSSLMDMGFRSYIGVPLESKGKILGTVCVFGKLPLITKPETLALMRAVGQQTGVAIENAALFEQTQSTIAETESLYQASAMINAAHSYQDILQAVCNHTILGQADSNVTIDIFDTPWTKEARPDCIHVLARKSPTHTGILGTRHEIDDMTNVSDYLNPDEIVIISDIIHDPRLDDYARSVLIDRFDAKCTMFVPLIAGGQWIGYLNGIYRKDIAFSAQDIRRVKTLAGQVGAAVQNIRLLQESQRLADQLQTAAEIARDTTGTLSLENLLDRAVELIRERFGYYQASIFLLDDEGKNAVVSAASGAAGLEMKRQGHKLAVGSQSIIGYVTDQREALVVNDVSQYANYYANPLLPETRSEMGIPLKIGQRVIGALDVQSSQENAFEQDDIDVLQTLADQIAVAVDNAKAYALSLQAVDEMREADRLKSQFLANMSHELRTPLNSIIGFSRVILKGIDGPVTELQEQDLNAIYNSGQHLLHLINDILDLSKIEAGKMELSLERDIDIALMINSVTPTVRGLIKDKPIELQQDIEDDLPVVCVDPTKIRQVMINLLSNAAKFTDVGSITIKAATQISPNGDKEIVISVIDTGQGIDPNDQKKLFQPFSQVDASPTRKSGGSGLGLSISRHFVEMHGGQIGVTSQPGEGSTFYFYFPIGSDQTLPDFSSDGEPKYTILTVDQEIQITHLYQRYLANHGYQVVPLTDPDMTIEVARELQPTVITLDIASTSGEGWEILQELKTDEGTKDIPVIVCSILDERVKGLKNGADEYLLKPILEDDLVQAIEKFTNS